MKNVCNIIATILFLACGSFLSATTYDITVEISLNDGTKQVLPKSLSANWEPETSWERQKGLFRLTDEAVAQLTSFVEDKNLGAQIAGIYGWISYLGVYRYPVLGPESEIVDFEEKETPEDRSPSSSGTMSHADAMKLLELSQKLSLNGEKLARVSRLLVQSSSKLSAEQKTRLVEKKKALTVKRKALLAQAEAISASAQAGMQECTDETSELADAMRGAFSGALEATPEELAELAGLGE